MAGPIALLKEAREYIAQYGRCDFESLYREREVLLRRIDEELAKDRQLAALPQLVAALEAAEDVCALWDDRQHTMVRDKVRAALAKLKETP